MSESFNVCRVHNFFLFGFVFEFGESCYRSGLRGSRSCTEANMGIRDVGKPKAPGREGDFKPMNWFTHSPSFQTSIERVDDEEI